MDVGFLCVTSVTDTVTDGQKKLEFMSTDTLKFSLLCLLINTLFHYHIFPLQDRRSFHSLLKPYLNNLSFWE